MWQKNYLKCYVGLFNCNSGFFVKKTIALFGKQLVILYLHFVLKMLHFKYIF